MASIAENLQQTEDRIETACKAAGRAAQSVTLLVVSKTFPPEALREAHAAGARRFGENYVQEALDKIAVLTPELDGVEWHLIGPLQSNKTKPVAEAFDWVHSVDRLKIAQRLSDQRPDHLPPLNICLQVNISGEDTKSGLAPAEVAALAVQVVRLPRLRLRGLMAVPEPASSYEDQRIPHRALAALQQRINDTQGLTLDTLSIGMSADLEAAIAEGATIVRVGSAIFGSRTYGKA